MASSARGRDVETSSLAGSTISSLLPPYEEHGRAPRYTRDSERIHDTRHSTHAHGHRGGRFFMSRRDSPNRVVPDRVRAPPEHLSKRPAILPAPSSRSPFHEIDRAFVEASPVVPGRRAVGRRTSRPLGSHQGRVMPRPPLHGDAQFHKFHNVKDNRMHVVPALDENGEPKDRLSTSGGVAAGAAIGIVAISACSLM